MAKITVNRVSGLSDYGTAIKNFSDQYSSAMAQTARTFSDKVEGAQAEAITAFLGRLNTIQTTVFDRFPEVLSEYATVVSTYESELSGAGFQDEAWTDDDGVELVASELTGKQVRELNDVKKDLQKAMNQASDAMGMSYFDLSPKASDIAGRLSDAANQRRQKNTSLQTAHTSFMNGLDNSLDALTNLEGPLANAVYTIQIPASTVMTAIKHGNLTQDEMYYFDYVINEDNRKAFQSVIGTGAEVELIKEVNPEKVSDEMYYFMSGQMEEWIRLNSVRTINAFYSALGELPSEQNEILFKKLVTESSKRAGAYQIQMAEEFGKNGGRMDTVKMKDLIAKQNVMNQVIGINKGLYIIGFGEQVLEVRPGVMSEDMHLPRTITFEQIGNAGDWEFTVRESWGAKDTYRSEFRLDNTAVNSEEFKIRFAEINEAERTATKELWMNIAKLTVEAGVVMVAPEVIPVLMTINALTSEQISERHGELVALSGLDETRFGYTTNTMVKIAESLLSYHEKMEQLSDDEKKTLLQMKSNIVDKGAWLFQGIGDTVQEPILDDTHYYDFKVTARILELDSQGFTGYIKAMRENGYDISRQSIEVKLQNNKYEDANDNWVSYPPEIIAYVLGENDELKFNEMSPEQLVALDSAMDEMSRIYGRDSISVTDYLENKYDPQINYNVTGNN